MHPILLVALVPQIIEAKSNRDPPQVSKMMLAAWLQRVPVEKHSRVVAVDWFQKWDSVTLLV